jgi:DNA-directed RNA polymerase specialized sigma24 family protein
MDQSAGSVTRLIKKIESGDSSAESLLVRRYFEQLARLCEAKLSTLPSRGADGEDVALSVLDTFLRRVKRRKFPDLKNREDLWSLLFVMALRKASSARRRERAQKRGGGKVLGENLLQDAEADEGWGLDLAMGKEPTAELAADLGDTLARLGQVFREQKLDDVARLKLAGHTNEEIAERIGRKRVTVERRLKLIRQILNKLSSD